VAAPFSRLPAVRKALICRPNLALCTAAKPQVNENQPQKVALVIVPLPQRNQNIS
jgi:hypothetical protein